MAKKKEIEKDEQGNPIVPGGKTFGDALKPRNGKASRTNELKSRAENRIVLLLKKGSQADRLARKVEPITDERHLEALLLQNNLANSPKVVQFAYHYGRLRSLREDLFALIEGKNKLKIDLIEPTIKRDIEETERIMQDLFHDIKMERRVIRR